MVFGPVGTEGPAGISATVGRLTGREPEMTPEGVAIVLARARVTSRKAERELGYQPAALATMIDHSYRWLTEQGLL